MAASRKRCTRVSARSRAESSERATACSRQLRLSGSGGIGYRLVLCHWRKGYPIAEYTVNLTERGSFLLLARTGFCPLEGPGRGCHPGPVGDG